MNEYVLLVIFFLVAAFYSSVGFGGGSSYLAILSFVLADFYEIRTLALVLNVLVVTIGTIAFVRRKIFNWSAFWPFVLLSVPMAFLGARMRLSENTFFLLLGASLVLAALFMFLQSINRNVTSRELNVPKRAGLGGVIGFISGLVGIGGGIFLSPTLNLMGWKNPKSVAALASLFILVNSVAGISGLLMEGTFELNPGYATKIIGVVVVGGLLGSQLSIKMNIHLIRTLTAILIMYVGVRIILLHGFAIAI